MQYYERQRFELHPGHAGTPYEVLLGLLGREVLLQRPCPAALARASTGTPGPYAPGQPVAHTVAVNLRVTHWLRQAPTSRHG